MKFITIVCLAALGSKALELTIRDKNGAKLYSLSLQGGSEQVKVSYDQSGNLQIQEVEESEDESEEDNDFLDDDSLVDMDDLELEDDDQDYEDIDLDLDDDDVEEEAEVEVDSEPADSLKLAAKTKFDQNVLLEEQESIKNDGIDSKMRLALNESIEAELMQNN